MKEEKDILEAGKHRRFSLASHINAMHRALTAQELADLVSMKKVTILRRAKRGTIPCFHIGGISAVRFVRHCEMAYAERGEKSRPALDERNYLALYPAIASCSAGSYALRRLLQVFQKRW